MGAEKIMSLLNAGVFKPTIRYYKYVMDSKTNNCAKCLHFAGEIFAENDPRKPYLPRHPNCDCYFAEVGEEEYLKQKNFEFGKMTHLKWGAQSQDEKYLWCNSFRNRFGDAIDKYAKEYNVPKQLLAGVIANEMQEWKFPDGTPLDGVAGGGIGYAQIAVKTARAYGVTGSDSEIKNVLKSYEGSVAVAARILKDYFEEFRNGVLNDKLGVGFKKSNLYYTAKPHILKRDDCVEMNVPIWVLAPMCAVWNSGIEIIYAKEKIGENNYRNAYRQSKNVYEVSDYLSKLVNE